MRIFFPQFAHSAIGVPSGKSAPAFTRLALIVTINPSFEGIQVGAEKAAMTLRREHVEVLLASRIDRFKPSCKSRLKITGIPSCD